MQEYRIWLLVTVKLVVRVTLSRSCRSLLLIVPVQGKITTQAKLKPEV